jgi:hypothetical protein
VATINEYALGRIVAAFEGWPGFISERGKSQRRVVHYAFRPWFQTVLHIVPCGISDEPGMTSGAEPGKPVIPASVAGMPGPCGPRTGNSSGMRPGNSSGRGGSPGSCIGGGTSGRGLPGGLSCGGSTGWPGLIGGSSIGSIGISGFFPEKISIRHQRRDSGNVPLRRY